MEKEIVTVIYDRKNEVAKKGRGKVEIRIYLGNGARKYVTINNCDPFEWKVYQTSKELQTQLCIYKDLYSIHIAAHGELLCSSYLCPL